MIHTLYGIGFLVVSGLGFGWASFKVFVGAARDRANRRFVQAMQRAGIWIV